MHQIKQILFFIPWDQQSCSAVGVFIYFLHIILVPLLLKLIYMCISNTCMPIFNLHFPVNRPLLIIGENIPCCWVLVYSLEEACPQ